MATFTCWCGHTIRDNDAPENAGHILWDNVDGFYEKVAADLLSFAQEQSKGSAPTWIHDYFGPLALTDLSPAEVAEDIVDQVIIRDQLTSGIYRCPICKRVHIHIKGTNNQWESYIPEGRVSGE